MMGDYLHLLIRLSISTWSSGFISRRTKRRTLRRSFECFDEVLLQDISSRFQRDWALWATRRSLEAGSFGFDPDDWHPQETSRSSVFESSTAATARTLTSESIA